MSGTIAGNTPQMLIWACNGHDHPDNLPLPSGAGLNYYQTLLEQCEIAKKSEKEPVEVFEMAVEEVGPMVEVKARRVGGATYQIPMEVRPARRSALAMRWIATYARSRSEKNMTLRLANELLDACEGRGEAVKKKEDTHRMAEANRAFSHFRF